LLGLQAKELVPHWLYGGRNPESEVLAKPLVNAILPFDHRVFSDWPARKELSAFAPSGRVDKVHLLVNWIKLGISTFIAVHLLSTSRLFSFLSFFAQDQLQPPTLPTYPS